MLPHLLAMIMMYTLQGLTTAVTNKTTEPLQIVIHAEVVESSDSDPQVPKSSVTAPQ
jgi:hypothetical protein